MMINCNVCNINNKVIEIQELEDIEDFCNRKLIIGVCRRCNKDIALLIETRKSDNKVFYDRLHDSKATDVIKREKKRLKYKFNSNDYSSFDWIYGKNVEIKNKQGKVVQVRQYACNYRANNAKLVKTIFK